MVGPPRRLRRAPPRTDELANETRVVTSRYSSAGLMCSAPSRRVAICVVVFALVVCQGCSFAFMRPAPAGIPAHAPAEGPTASPGRCTASMLAPIGDSAGATLLAGLVGLLAGFPEIDGHPKSARAPALAAASLGVVAYVASAVYGFDNASRCEAAVDPATSTQAASRHPDTPRRVQGERFRKVASHDRGL